MNKELLKMFSKNFALWAYLLLPIAILTGFCWFYTDKDPLIRTIALILSGSGLMFMGLHLILQYLILPRLKNSEVV